MRSLPWLAGVATAAAVTAVAQTAVVVELAALTGVVWGVVAWTYVGYPAARSLSYEGLEGGDRWLAAMSLVIPAAAFAAVRVLADGATATVLYAHVLGVSVGLVALGALVEART